MVALRETASVLICETGQQLLSDSLDHQTTCAFQAHRPTASHLGLASGDCRSGTTINVTGSAF